MMLMTWPLPLLRKVPSFSTLLTFMLVYTNFSCLFYGNFLFLTFCLLVVDSSPKNVYKDPDDGRQRFLLELEFVQCLANPTYIHCMSHHLYAVRLNLILPGELCNEWRSICYVQIWHRIATLKMKLSLVI